MKYAGNLPKGEVTSEAEETVQTKAWRPRRVWNVYELLVVAGALWAWGRIGRALSLISNGASIFLEDWATGTRQRNKIGFIALKR